MFGVAWGAIPEIDLKSEFLRFMGHNRAWVTAFWKWIFPSVITGIEMIVFLKPCYCSQLILKLKIKFYLPK